MMNDTSDPAELERYLGLFRAAENNFEEHHAEYAEHCGSPGMQRDGPP